MASRFIDNNKDNWQRLEDLLGMIHGKSLRGLSRMEVREFGELYRRAATDLAIARAETRDPKLIKYLNSLVVRAHGKIYRAEGDGATIFKRFFSTELPQAVRSVSRFILIAFLVFLVCGIASFLLAYYDPTYADLVGVSDVEASAANDERWWLSLNDGNQIGSSQILTNNIGVTLYAFALGVFFCIGTIYIIAFNGVFIGGILGVCYRVDPAFGNELVNFMFAHGVVELTCIFIAGGAGMAIGYSIIDPGNLTRTQALKKAGTNAAKIVIGCALFLVIAGIIEGFLSPSSLPVYIKYATGILTGLALFAYLFFAGRNSEAEIRSKDAVSE